MKELYSKTFKIHDDIKFRLLKKKEIKAGFDNRNVLIKIPVNRHSGESYDRIDIMRIIWRIRQLKDVKIKEAESNNITKNDDIVGYMMIDDVYHVNLYLDLTGKIWFYPKKFYLNRTIEEDQMLIIPVEEFGKFIEVPNIYGIKEALNIFNMMDNQYVFDVLDMSVLNKLANTRQSKLDDMSDLVKTLRDRSRERLTKMGIKKFRKEEEEE